MEWYLALLCGHNVETSPSTSRSIHTSKSNSHGLQRVLMNLNMSKPPGLQFAHSQLCPAILSPRKSLTFFFVSAEKLTKPVRPVYDQFGHWGEIFITLCDVNYHAVK